MRSLWVLALAASQEHGRRPLHERRRRPVRDKTARQQAAAARARARGYMETVETPRVAEDLTETAMLLAIIELPDGKADLRAVLSDLGMSVGHREKLLLALLGGGA